MNQIIIINQWLKMNCITKDYCIDRNIFTGEYQISINSNITINNSHIKEIPEYIHFNVIKGDLIFIGVGDKSMHNILNKINNTIIGKVLIYN